MTPIETQTTIQSDSNIADIPLMLCRSLVLAYKLTTRVVKFRRGRGGGGEDEEKAEAEEGKAGCSKGCGLGQFQGGRLLEKIWFVPSLMTAVKGVEGYNFTMISFLSLQSLTRRHTCRSPL